MKNVVLRAVPLLTIAMVSVQCGGEPAPVAQDSDSATPAETASQPEPEPMAELVATLKRVVKPNEQVQLARGPDVEELLETLRAEDVKSRILNDFNKKAFHYYANQLIPKLRKRDGLWLVTDVREPDAIEALHEFFLKGHRVESEQQFGDLRLLRVVNELRAGGGPARRARVVSVAKPGGVVTDIQFAPSGDIMFTAAKHGVVGWRSMTGEGEGVVLTLPRSKDGGKGLFAGGESGLIGIALHPGFPETPKLYTHYIFNQGNGERDAIVSEWLLDLSKEQITADDERIVMKTPQPNINHNAGQLAFGPDGYLYVAIGDGQEGDWLIGRSRADSIRGKVLRIDVDAVDEGREYGIPSDNPFVGHDTIPPETWAWGFRNPWRMAFTPDGRLIAGDIGEDRNEEITFVKRGRHHGWPFEEGSFRRLDAGFREKELKQLMQDSLGDEKPEPPLFAYDRDLGMSVTAGNVYEGDDIDWLKGKYVFGDYLSGRLWAIDLPEPGEQKTFAVEEVEEIGRWPHLFTCFGKHPNGDLYLGSGTGRVFRLEEGGVGAEPGDDGAIAELDHGVVRGMFGSEFPAPERGDIGSAEIALGRMLYDDPRLFPGADMSCATCHSLDRYGQDGLRVSTAKAHGDTAPRRNTPTTFNAHRQFAQLRDQRAKTVEEVVTLTLLGEHGFDDESEVAATLGAVPEYEEAFAKAFPGESEPVTATNAARALGAFVRQLATRSRWDDYLDGDDAALNAEERRGLSVFVSVGCVTCHQFRALGGTMSQKLGLLKPWTGEDEGRAAVTGDEAQRHYFKVPPMLNVAETAPYYHDGSVPTLEEAVRHMADIQLGRELTGEQVRALVAFLGALTGSVPEILR